MRRTAAVVFALLCLLALAASAQGAESRLPLGHLGAFTEPKGSAVDQGSHEVYVIGGRSEAQTITVSATGGKFKVRFEGKEGEFPFNIKDSLLETELQKTFCAGSGCLSVTGGPGDASGTNPYVVRFGGPLLLTTDVAQIECESGSTPLTGGSASCTAATSVNGVNGSVTRYHADGTPSSFSALGANAIDGRGGADLTPQGGLHFSNSNLVQVALDESGGATDGEIYVTQSPNRLADVFAGSGAYLGQLSQYETTPGNAGTLAPLGLVCGVAVDAAGNVYLADLANGIHKYDPSGAVVSNTDNVANFTSVSEPCTLAAGRGPTGEFLFADRANGELFKLDASTGVTKYLISKGNTTVTVDPSTGHVLAAAGAQVQEWDASGAIAATAVGSIAAGSTTSGVSVDGGLGKGKGGTVYVSRTRVSHLDVYGPYVKLPVVVAKAASEVAAASAKLGGTISADGGPGASCHFQYILDATFQAQKKVAEEESEAEPKTSAEIAEAAFAGASSAPCVPVGPFSGATVNEVSALAAGLDPEAKYEFRLVGENEEGQIPSAELNFETLGKPEVQGGFFSQVSATTALITATVNPRGLDTTFLAEYVTRQQFEESGFAAAITISGPQVPKTVSGKGDLSAASGSGDLAAGFSQLKGLEITAGTFEPGQTISGAGIQAGTKIVSVDLAAKTIDISQPAAASGAKVAISAGSTTVTNLIASAGHFAAGQLIEGAGIPASTTVLSVTATSLVLSAAPTLALQGASLSATGSQPASVRLGGLAPNSPYVFRAAAQNEAGLKSEAQAHTFTTQPLLDEAPLPDGRAYEEVSPAAKLGEVFPPESGPREGLGGTCKACIPGWNAQKAPMQASADGSAFAYEGNPFAPDFAPGPNSYVARRGLGGWESTDLSPAQLSGELPQGYKAFSADFSKAIVLQIEPALTGEAPANFANLYLREEGKGGFTALNTTEPPQREAGRKVTNAFQLTFAGANAGGGAAEPFTHVIFQANDALTGAVEGIAPAAPPVGAEETDLYEWSEGEGLRLVNVLPGNGAASPNAVFGSGKLSGTALQENFDFEHAISNDGQRIFWSEQPSGQLYVREGGTTTSEIPDPGKFLTATPSGSEVLLSDGMLYDLEDATLTDLTEGQGGFQGIAGTSEGLARIYFVDTKALTPPEEENENSEAAEDGKFNLYLWEEGEVAHEGATRFIGQLVAGDNQSGAGLQVGIWHPAPGNRLAQASASGRFLAFESLARLSGYDNTVASGEHCPLGGKEGFAQCFEVFEYDAASGKLSCVSCNPSGERPEGQSNLAQIKSSEEFFPQPENLPPAGEGRLFFESQDTLSEGDTNGKIQDVYEFEPQGVGDCERGGGCLALISSGHGAKDSHFVNASATGDDVFFTTRDQLVPRDKDDFMDLYDARVGGGLEEEAPAPCEGEGCAGPIPAPPGQQAPGSSQVAGGEEAPAPVSHCRRGYIRRHGRCVRKAHRHPKHRRATQRHGGHR